MSKINLEILTPAKRLFNNDVNSVIVPGTKGNFQILYGHAPIISTIDIGTIKVEISENATKHFATGGGTVEVQKNKVTILADSLEAAEDIDIERAQNALARAKDRLDNKETQKIEVERAKAAMARALNRIKIVEKHLNEVK